MDMISQPADCNGFQQVFVDISHNLAGKRRKGDWGLFFVGMEKVVDQHQNLRKKRSCQNIMAEMVCGQCSVHPFSQCKILFQGGMIQRKEIPFSYRAFFKTGKQI